MKTTLVFCLTIGGCAVGAYGASSLPVGAVQEKERIALPESVRFSESMRELVAAANAGDTKGSLKKLHNLDRDLPPGDPNHPRSAFLAALRDLDPKVIGTFEDSLIARYTSLMAAPEKLSEADKSELEMIATIARESMSLRLAKLFLRDVTKVAPYIFKENVERSGWRPADVDDWKGLQGRMVSASIASDDLQILKDWIALAETSTGDLQLLIWWGLGYSLREEAFNYLLGQHSRGLGGREKIIVEYALNWEVQGMHEYSDRLEKYKGRPFGVLTPTDVESLRARVQKLALKLERRLKNEGISVGSAASMYRE